MSIKREEFGKLKPVTEDELWKRPRKSEEEKKEAKKEYMKQYDLAHSEERKEYYLNNLEERKECSRNYYQENKEERKEYNKEHAEVIKVKMKQYKSEHAETIKEYMEDWHRENKERIKEYSRNYYQENVEAIKLTLAEYLKTEKGKAIKRKIDARAHAKRKRGLGFYPINEQFPDSHAHHFNKEGIIYIPAVLHRSVKHNVFSGEGMQEINRFAFEWLENVELGMPIESWMR